jgi:hypothetical protein
MTEYKTIAETNRFIVLDQDANDCKLAESYQSEDALERELVADLQNLGYTFEKDLNTPVYYFSRKFEYCKSIQNEPRKARKTQKIGLS